MCLQHPQFSVVLTLMKTFELALNAEDVKYAIMRGKIASLLGVEGYVWLIRFYGQTARSLTTEVIN